MRLLLIEDDRDFAEVLEASLEELGFQVDLAHDAVQGEQLAMEGGYDLMVVGQEGRWLIHRLRMRKLDSPILMLMADRNKAGSEADDYLCKPFSFDELAARVRLLADRVELSAD